MKRKLVLIMGISLRMWSQSTATAQTEDLKKTSDQRETTVGRSFAFVDVGIIDVEKGRLVTHSTVIVSDGRVLKIGPTQDLPVPSAVRSIPATGKFLIPGLWNMHVHLGNATEAALPALVASGVTSVRDMGSPSYITLKRWSIEGLKGDRIGPRIFAAGPILDSGTPDLTRYIVNTPDEGRKAVDELVRQGVDFIKVHEHLSRATYLAIAEEARTLGIAFAGHVPVGENGFSVSATEASEAGQKSLEHFYGIPFSTDDPSVPEMLRTLKRNGTWVCPTLIVFWNRAHLRELGEQSAKSKEHVAPSLKTFWGSQLKELSPDERVPNILLSARRSDIKLLSDAHIPLLAGTDLGFVYVTPRDLAKELGLMVEAGLRPAEALRAATINPAIFMGQSDQMGSIVQGKVADLVLLDGDPLLDIHAVERVDCVVVNGRYLSHNVLKAAIPSFN